MQRRDFIKAVAGSATTWPLAASAQQPQRTRLVGILLPFPESDAGQQTRFRAFRQELTKLGWSEGSDVQFDVRWTEFSVIGKMVETLKEMAPGISRVGIIYNPDNPVGAVYLNSFKAVAAQLAVQSIDLPVHGPADIERAIGSLAEQPNGGFITPPDLTVAALATEITTLAARHRVPAIYSGSPFYVRRGGLVGRDQRVSD